MMDGSPDDDAAAWKRIGEVAESVGAAGVPDDLNRWIGMTPAGLKQTEVRMAKVGDREQQLRKMREAKTETTKKATTPKAAPAAETEAKDETMRNPSKTAKTKAAPKAKTTRSAVKGKTTAKPAAKAKKAAAPARAPSDGPRPGSKLEIVAKLLQNGCTAKEVMVACGWPSVSMPQQALALGVKLVKEKVDGVTRYKAA